MGSRDKVGTHENAWHDCWAFFDLINFQGGTRNFDQCHYDYVLVLSAYQKQQTRKLTNYELERLRIALEQPELTTAPNNRLLQMPRGHLKSTLVVGYILWRVYRNPNVRILHATNVRELSTAFIRELRAHLEDEDLQEAVWNNRPHIRGNLVPSLDRYARRYRDDDNESEDKKVVWSNQQLQVVRGLKSKEPTVLSTSVKSKTTGQHYDIVIMDDIVDHDNSSTPLKIRAVKRWAGDVASIRTKVRTRVPCGVMPSGEQLFETLGDEYVVTGTHYDPHDYYAFIKANMRDLSFGVLNRNIYANSTDASDGYLWKRFTANMERELRSELSDLPGVFEAQYLNLVNNPALQVLTTDYITWVSNQRLLENRSSDYLAIHCDDGSIDYVDPIMAVDFAISLSSRADLTAIAVGGKTYQRKLCAVDISAGHYTVEQTLDEIVRLVRLWRVRRMYVETIAFQSLYRDRILKRLQDERISCGVLDYKPAGNKHKRIESHIVSYFNSGDVIFNDHLRNKPHIMNTFSFFGRASAKDDPPDALAVVAEHSHPPNSTDTKHKRLSPARLRSAGFNLRYGGVY